MPVRLEDLKPDAQVLGLLGKEAVRIVSAQMMGDAACQVVFRRQDGGIGDTIAFRSQEAELELVAGGRKWSFEGDGDLFRLVAEAEGIRHLGERFHTGQRISVAWRCTSSGREGDSPSWGMT